MTDRPDDDKDPAAADGADPHAEEESPDAARQALARARAAAAARSIGRSRAR